MYANANDNVPGMRTCLTSSAGAHSSRSDTCKMPGAPEHRCHSTLGESISAGHLFLTIAHLCLFCPPSPNKLEYLLAVSKNLAHPLHPVYDDGKGGGWKWWG